MNRKLNCILLIDDNEHDNFLHERTINKLCCAKKVVTLEKATDALEYLKGGNPKPDLIFLDINMPGMNGWEFLTHYEQLEEELQGKVVVVMLTTSVNPREEERSKNVNAVRDFINKPLTAEVIEDVLSKHFTNNS